MCRKFSISPGRKVNPLLNALTRYMDTLGTGVGTRTTELFCEAREVFNKTVDHDTDTFQAGSIITGGCGGQG